MQYTIGAPQFTQSGVLCEIRSQLHNCAMLHFRNTQPRRMLRAISGAAAPRPASTSKATTSRNVLHVLYVAMLGLLHST